MDLDLDFSDDYIVVDNLEPVFLVPSRNSDGGYVVDLESGMYTPGNEPDRIQLENCLLREVSHRDQALVKQVFARGVALASLDFNVLDTILEVYEDYPEINLEDRIEARGKMYTVIAKDSSTMTGRLRLGLRSNG